MTQITLNIQDNKYSTFLEFIKTLDYVKVNDNDTILTQEQKNAIDIGLKELDEGKGIPHETVMAGMKQEFPKYFK
tara:strand:- start:367 stop:591 length:225 start_codon:yes stop_codon:yes gene_type:complete